MSPSVLNSRLKEMRESRLVELDTKGYVLTPEGVELIGHLKPLNRWAQKWQENRFPHP